MRSPTSAFTTGASASMTGPGRIPISRQRPGENEHRRERPAVDLLRACRDGRARPAEEADAERLDEAGGGERRRQRQHRADRRDHELQPPLRQVRAEQDRLEGQPLGDEAVERRQRRDRHASGEEHEGGQRHAMDEAAEMLHVALAGRGQHRAGAEEQQALEDAVVEDVEQRRGHGERGCRRHRVRLEGERKAEPDEDDADILDRAVGEEPLQVALQHGVEHADHRGRAAEHQHGTLHHHCGAPSRSKTTRTKP